MWDRLYAQFEKVAARNQFLAANPTHPDWPELDAKATRSDRKFGEMRNELAEWAGICPSFICALLARPLPPGDERR